MNDIKPFLAQGRIVYVIGDLFKGEIAKVYGSNVPKLNKQGQQYREYGFGLAVPKEALSKMAPGEPGEIWAKIHEAAYQLFPDRNIPPRFHMKYKDGDTGTNQDGTPVNTKEGYPGHIVFSLKTTFPIKFFRYENGQNFQINEGIKCGDYVNVQLSVGSHTGTNAGLYLNPLAVQFLGYGKEIVNAPTANQTFGVAPPPLPPGASSTPVAPVGMIMPGQPAAPQYAQPAAPAPNYGVLPPQFHPQQPATPAIPSMPPLPFRG